MEGLQGLDDDGMCNRLDDWMDGMSIMKDFFMDEIEKLHAEAEERGEFINDDKMAELANQRAIDRFADMCDAAQDRAKYGH